MQKVENIDNLAFELGCKLDSLPFICLDLLLGALFDLMTVWNNCSIKVGYVRNKTLSKEKERR